MYLSLNYIQGKRLSVCKNNKTFTAGELIGLKKFPDGSE